MDKQSPDYRPNIDLKKWMRYHTNASALPPIIMWALVQSTLLDPIPLPHPELTEEDKAIISQYSK